MDDVTLSGQSVAVERARDAVRRLAWDDACAAFADIDQGASLHPGDLEDWATATYLLGRADEAVEILSRAYALHLDGDEPDRAARVGFWVVYMLSELGESAQAGGWMARCSRLLGQLPADSAAHCYMLALRAYQLVAVEENYVEGHEAAEDVIRLARSVGDRDVEALALNIKGRALVRAGRVDDGLPVLDEAMVSVVSGRLSPIVVGTIYCSLIEACEEVAELRRAHEWTEALTRWCDRQGGEVPFTGQCRIYRSKILRRNGDLKVAESEARRAYELFTGTPYHAATGRALYQLAEVHRIRGEVDQAADAYRRASEFGVDPQPGLALLRLSQGDSDKALGSLRRVVAETEGPVDRIRLLPALVEVMLATGDVTSAEEAASELSRLSAMYETDALVAEASFAEATVSLARGDPGAALPPLRSAFALWQASGSVHESARVRVEISRACRLLGDDETADLELSAARQMFHDLGVADLTGPVTDSRAAKYDLTSRELDVLRLLATGATNKSIADDLYLSVRTVDRHVANLLTKIGVNSRTAAVSFGYQNGLV